MREAVTQAIRDAMGSGNSGTQVAALAAEINRKNFLLYYVARWLTLNADEFGDAQKADAAKVVADIEAAIAPPPSESEVA